MWDQLKCLIGQIPLFRLIQLWLMIVINLIRLEGEVLVSSMGSSHSWWENQLIWTCSEKYQGSTLRRRLQIVVLLKRVIQKVNLVIIVIHQKHSMVIRLFRHEKRGRRRENWTNWEKMKSLKGSKFKKNKVWFWSLRLILSRKYCIRLLISLKHN